MLVPQPLAFFAKAGLSTGLTERTNEGIYSKYLVIPTGEWRGLLFVAAGKQQVPRLRRSFASE
jgi:hypothetical protein